MTVVVVGAGIAGSCLTRHLRARGVPVTLVSSGVPHSLAATAVLRRAWHRGPDRDWFDESRSWYDRWGIPVTTGAQVTSYRRDDVRADPDWAFTDPAGPLLVPDRTALVTAVTGQSVTLASGETLPADTVVRATGATGPLAIAGQVTWGGTWVAPDTWAGIRVHLYAPYKVLAAAGLGTSCRAGSSSASTHLAAVEAARRQLTLARDQALVPPTARWELVTGARVKADPLYARDADGTWRVGGFHRTGYALAPAVTRQLADRLC